MAKGSIRGPCLLRPLLYGGTSKTPRSISSVPTTPRPSNVVLLRLGGSCQCSSDDLVLRMDHVFIDGETHLVGDTHQQIGLPVEKEYAGDPTTIFNCDHAPEPLSVKAVALIIEEMGCKPPHVATDKIDIDEVWKSFHCVHPLGRTVKLSAEEEPLTIIEHLRWRIGP